MEIKDSGQRREFETGAVRDMAEGKGRFDLMPLETLTAVFGDDFISNIHRYMETGESWALHSATQELIMHFPTQYHAWLELAKHFKTVQESMGSITGRRVLKAVLT